MIMKNSIAGQCGCSRATTAATKSSLTCSGCEGAECCNSNNPGSVELRDNQILIDGKPRLVLAGEVHYFRLAPEVWEDRLQRLQDNGLDTVSSYIPWLWHELPDGTVDLTGATHPQRNLVAFLELCAKRGLHFIARPGPFVMAELKNEGLPQRLYQAPFSRPTTWDDRPITTRTVDYLAPDFLAAAQSWYAAVMPLLAEHLHTRGGPVIAVQLDNEIGMLSWVSNCPELTDVVCEDMRLWARTHYGPPEATKIIGAESFDSAAWAAKLRSPGDASLPLHQALGLYMRDRFRRYVQILRHYAEQAGAVGVPFLINVHGTGGDRGRTFPIGISQLKETYRGQSQMTAGSDLYLGSLSATNIGDLVVVNAFLKATLDAHQPVTSLELDAGSANYGDDLGVLSDPESIELKSRLLVAQECRAFNFYLHAGGENPPMPSLGDGIDRLAFTGQRHGFAAPVSPEGEVGPYYFALGRVAKTMRAVEDLLANSRTEYDGVAIGFVPDHYLTEHHYPGSAQRTAQIADLERYRGFGPRDLIARVMVLAGFTFPAVDLQEGVPETKALVLTTGRTLSREVQQNLVDYVEHGGKLLLVGLLPEVDHDGTPCTLLSDALGLKSAGRVEDAVGPHGQYWPSVSAQGWVAPRPEVRATRLQLLESMSGEPLEPLLTEIASGKPCAVKLSLGEGQVLFLGCDYPADLGLYRALLSSLGVKPSWQVVADQPGAFASATVTEDGQRLLHIINVAPYPVSFTLRHGDTAAFGRKRLQIAARSGLMLPMEVKVHKAVIRTSTAEILRRGRDGFVVQPTQDVDVIALRTNHQVKCKQGHVERSGNLVLVWLKRELHHGKPVKIVVR